MAKKKVTKKKIKKKPASRVSKKTTRKSSAPKTKKKTKKKTSKKKTTRKAPARKITKKKVTKKKTAKKVAKKPTAALSKQTKKKKTTVAAKGSGKKTSSRSKRSAKRPEPDANGYVIINGRRVRMMSVSAEVVTPAAKRVRRRKATLEPEPQNKTRKPIKTKLHKKDLDHYRTLLLHKRTELVGDLNSMETQALKSNGGQLSHMPIHMADVGTQ